MINPPDEYPSEGTAVQIHNWNSINRTIDGQTRIIIGIRIRAKTEFQKIVQTIQITGIREVRTISGIRSRTKILKSP